MAASTFVIRGHLEPEQDGVCATCENVPISVSGADDSSVLDGMIKAISLYVGELSDDEWASLTTTGNEWRGAAPTFQRDGARFDVRF